LSISKHTTYNLLGAVLPLGITLLTVPLYLGIVGLERYGVLTICWVLLGYLGFLDLGLGPAVSQKIASASDDSSDTPEAVFWTALWLSLGTGLLGALILYAGAAFYFASGALVSTFRSEVKDVVPLLGALLPVAMMSSVASGALHGRQRFLTLNLISTTSASLMTALPLLVAYFWSPTLKGLVAGALAARAIGLLLQYWACREAVPLSKPAVPRADLIGSLLKFGGWVTISTAVAPLLLTIDRLAIGAVLGAAAVAAYSIPFSLISRMAIIPGSLSSALFPRFASGTDAERQRLLAAGLTSIAVVMTPASILLMAATQPFLTLWVGPDLAAVSSPVAYLLIVGTWSNSLAFIPYALLQGSGRPDAVSKIHLIEILPYWGLLAAGLLFFGLPGAAMAWAVRTTVDCGLLFWRSGVEMIRMRALIVPLLLVMGALFSAANLPVPIRYPAFAALLAASILWSLIAMPEPLREALRRAISLVLRRNLASTPTD
jgi:O-antigen/teichoic acid export membrane protein